MGLIAYGVIALAVMGALGGGYYYVHHDGYVEGKAEVQTLWNEANEAQRRDEAEKAGKAVKGKETGDAKAKVVYRTITKQVDKYIDRTVYRNLCFDADGLRDANLALSGSLIPAAKSDKPVPKPDAPR